MGYASTAGRARTNSRHPEAHAICDRCGCRYNLADLRWQFDWRGTSMQNLRILVCSPCYDEPQQQLRSIIIPADPQPVLNARPENFDNASVDYRAISTPIPVDPITGIAEPTTIYRITQAGDYRTTQAIGIPDDIDADAQPPQFETTLYGVKLGVLSAVADANSNIQVTAAAPHGLSSGAQVIAQGVAVGANGVFEVVVNSATAFMYPARRLMPPGSILLPNAIILTALVGQPREYTLAQPNG